MGAIFFLFLFFQAEVYASQSRDQNAMSRNPPPYHAAGILNNPPPYCEANRRNGLLPPPYFRRNNPYAVSLEFVKTIL